MKISEAFPSRFISAADLDKVKPGTPFVIRELAFEECMNPRTKAKEQKLVCYFSGGVKKGHRLRKSEANALIAAFGDDSEAWKGQTVTLGKVSTQTGPGVRMHPVKATLTEGGAQ